MFDNTRFPRFPARHTLASPIAKKSRGRVRTAMPETLCPHSTFAGEGRVCSHLLESHGYFQRFTGVGLEYDLVCSRCNEHQAEIEGNLRTVCAECFQRYETVWSWEGIIGKPEELARPCDL